MDAIVKRTAAVRNVRRRPTRSASRPAGISSAANTIVYALRIQDSDDADAEEKPALIEGKATNKIVVSRNTANTARLVLANTTHGLRGALVVPGPEVIGPGTGVPESDVAVFDTCIAITSV
jgi:hypothetical protein